MINLNKSQITIFIILLVFYRTLNRISSLSLFQEISNSYFAPILFRGRILVIIIGQLGRVFAPRIRAN